MSKTELRRSEPGLLVSVRNPSEALAALAGGVDIIDVKEPRHGSLGAADGQTIADIVRAVDGRAIVSAAMGELTEFLDSFGKRKPAPIVEGVSLFKVGLAGCRKIDDWQEHWWRTIASMAKSQQAGATQPVAVVYADWKSAAAPSPQEVLNVAIECRCPALLIDTWNKSDGGLFDHWPADELRRFLATVRSHALATVLAGSLTSENIAAAARLMPDLIAVRTAACDGGRQGLVSETRVRELKNSIAMAVRDIAVA